MQICLINESGVSYKQLHPCYQIQAVWKYKFQQSDALLTVLFCLSWHAGWPQAQHLGAGDEVWYQHWQSKCIGLPEELGCLWLPRAPRSRNFSIRCVWVPALMLPVKLNHQANEHCPGFNVEFLSRLKKAELLLWNQKWDLRVLHQHLIFSKAVIWSFDFTTIHFSLWQFIAKDCMDWADFEGKSRFEKLHLSPFDTWHLNIKALNVARAQTRISRTSWAANTLWKCRSSSKRMSVFPWLSKPLVQVYWIENQQNGNSWRMWPQIQCSRRNMT